MNMFRTLLVAGDLEFRGIEEVSVLCHVNIARLPLLFT